MEHLFEAGSDAAVNAVLLHLGGGGHIVYYVGAAKVSRRKKSTKACSACATDIEKRRETIIYRREIGRNVKHDCI